MLNCKRLWGDLRLTALIIAVVVPLVTVPARPSAAARGQLENVVGTAGAFTQDQAGRKSLTPLQLEIEKQRTRLSSAEVEERRGGVAELGSMHHPEASRAAVSALRDPAAIVRATAAASLLSLPPEESVAHLIPLLSDKDEFVRREAAYALGTTRSPAALSSLIDRLLNDKRDAVRGAAAVALGQIKSAAAVSALASVLSPQVVSA
ncbi:MAG: HEAT repeat domain-containing protein, partial [Acidobacteriota bacterium]|nr:HEAT repeat domain-containing protein [Acidobacteriota bacterium]